MQVFTTNEALRDWAGAEGTLALVPTRGGLHAGKLALVARARDEARRVLVAIIGGAGDPAQDEARLAEAGATALFRPAAGEFHRPGAQSFVETPELARDLLGRLRPGHFRAVATEVAKLIGLTRPDVALFGERDYQRLCVIRRMVADLDMGVRVLGVETLREADGLPVAAHNAALTAEDRAAARVLPQALDAAAAMARTGITASRLRAWVAATIQAEPRADLVSADIRDAQTLATIAGPLQRPAVILLAARLGGVMLLDQRVVAP